MRLSQTLCYSSKSPSAFCLSLYATHTHTHTHILSLRYASLSPCHTHTHTQTHTHHARTHARTARTLDSIPQELLCHQSCKPADYPRLCDRPPCCSRRTLPCPLLCVSVSVWVCGCCLCVCVCVCGGCMTAGCCRGGTQPDSSEEHSERQQ
jgi:hypothetical protein